MSIFNRLFGNNTTDQEEPKIRFGRYSDAYKATDALTAWDKAQAYFEREQYLRCYESFFAYLKDEDEDNVRINKVMGGLSFEVYQGSKKITGLATPLSVKAEAKIVKAESFNVGIMRRLLEQNFSLKYSRFALDDEGNICILFDTSTIDGSPYKLYYALQEVATKADKQDDLLLEEFKQLEIVEASHLKPLPQAEKEVKYAFIHKAITNTLKEVESSTLQDKSFARSIGYLLLDLVFKLDYLIKPEGFMMETLEHIHRKYYENDRLPVAQKNKILCEGLRDLLKRPKEDFFKEMYLVRSTFGITHTVNHDRVASFIANELPTMDWYEQNGLDTLALSIPGFVVGYCMFNYAVPKPDRELLHLYYHITESDYFKSLGFSKQFYDPVQATFDKRSIKKVIQKICDTNSDRYPNLNPDLSLLNFDNLVVFSRSYLNMIQALNLSSTR
jgi:hypothetical protein